MADGKIHINPHLKIPKEFSDTTVLFKPKAGRTSINKPKNVFPLKCAFVFLSSGKGHLKNSELCQPNTCISMRLCRGVLDPQGAHVHTTSQLCALPLTNVLRNKGNMAALEDLELAISIRIPNIPRPVRRDNSPT